MIYWITSLNGLVNFKVQAADAAEALDKLGRSLRYADFSSMAADLNYSAGDFSIATIEVQTGVYDSEGNRREIKRQEGNAITGAFRQLLRRG